MNIAYEVSNGVDCVFGLCGLNLWVLLMYFLPHYWLITISLFY